MKRVLLLSLAFLAVAGLFALKHPLKQVLLAMDARYLNDFVWSVTHPNPEVPRLPAMSPPAPGAYDWVPKTTFFPIAHALGASSVTTTNTITALDRAYADGARLFEVDIIVTRDNHLVCLHDTSEMQSDAFTYADFLAENRRLNRRTCTFADLLSAASTHPQIHFIMDVKNRYDDAYRLMRKQIGTRGLGQRFVPQLYRFSQLQQFRSDAFFSGPLFSSAFSRLSTRKIFAYAHKFQIPVVTLPADRLNRLREVEIRTGAPVVLGHPMDDKYSAMEWKEKGVRGIYTFSLFPRSNSNLYGN